MIGHDVPTRIDEHPGSETAAEHWRLSWLALDVASRDADDGWKNLRNNGGDIAAWRPAFALPATPSNTIDATTVTGLLIRIDVAASRVMASVTSYPPPRARPASARR